MSETIKLSEETQKIAKTYFDTITACDAGLLSLSQQRKEAHKRMWEVLKAAHPEVANRIKNSVYESEKGELIISDKWDKNDEMKYIERYIDSQIEKKFDGE